MSTIGRAFQRESPYNTMVVVVVIVLLIVFLVYLGVNSSKESTESSNYNLIETKKKKLPRYNYDKDFKCIIHEDEGGTYFKCSVRGLSFRSEEVIHRASMLALDEPLKLELEPSNPVDPNAIVVKTEDNYAIGYLPKEYANGLHKHMDSFVDCYVEDNLKGHNAPFIQIRVFFKVETDIYYLNLVRSREKEEEYKAKYQHFNDYRLSPKAYIKQWEQYLIENPDDFYIKYRYVGALKYVNDYFKAEEYLDNLLSEYNLSESLFFKDEVNSIKFVTERIRQTKQHEEMVLKQALGKKLMEKGHYEDAIETFKECLPLKQQLIPRYICKCYVKLGMQEELYDFVLDILKEDWITVNNRVLLEKYIQ